MTSTIVSFSAGTIVLGLLACAAMALAMFVVLASILGKLFSRPVVPCQWLREHRAISIPAVTAFVVFAATQGLRACTLTVADNGPMSISFQDTWSELSSNRKDVQGLAQDTTIVVSDINAAIKQSSVVMVASMDQDDVPSGQEPPTAAPVPSPGPTQSDSTDEPPEGKATDHSSSAQPAQKTGAADDMAVSMPGELKDNVSELIRSLLSQGTTAVRPAVPSPDSGKGALNQDGMMLLEMSPEDASAMFAGPEMLSNLKAQLPAGVKVAYALVPLTAPVDSAVAPVKPLLAAGSLQTLANQMVTLLEPFRTQPTAETARTSASSGASNNTGSNGNSDGPEPAWVRNPDGGRLTIQTRPVFTGDDPDQAVANAISEAYKVHAAQHFQALDPALVSMIERVDLRLDDSAVRLCLAEKPFSRKEQAKFGQEGEKPFEIIYALVQFPEAVDKVAESKIREALQQDRLLALGLAVGCAWISTLSVGGAIRTGTRGTGLRRFVVSFPFAAIATFALVGAIFVIIAAGRGTGLPVSAASEEPLVISIDLPDRA
ncbi:MAG: hypothetical protein ACK58L_07760 [Planctomycetota bacterium]